MLRLAGAFFCFELSMLGAYIFMATYFTEQFGMGTAGTSLGMLVLGVAIAITSVTLVGPVSARWPRWAIIATAEAVIVAAIGLLAFAPDPVLAYVALVPFAVAFAVAYPTFLSAFSASVDEDKQGWVMGVELALFTLAGGLISILSGDLASLDERAPFYLGAMGGVLALVLMATSWRGSTMRTVVGRDADGR